MRKRCEEGQIYESRNCGKFKIIERVDSPNKNAPKWKVRFLDTCYETEAYASNIRTGRVLDATIKNALGKYKEGQVLTRPNGDMVEILDIEKKKEAKRSWDRTILTVKFLDNGFITKCTPDNLMRLGKVRNLYKPTVSSIGCLGDVDHIVKKYGRIRDCDEYRIWEGVLKRCYGTKDKSYEKAEICDRWKRFDYFYNDIKNIEGYQLWRNFKDKYPNKKCIYEFDKDTKISGNKVYSPETVRFIHKKFNAAFTSSTSDKIKQQILMKIEEENNEQCNRNE